MHERVNLPELDISQASTGGRHGLEDDHAFHAGREVAKARRGDEGAVVAAQLGACREVDGGDARVDDHGLDRRLAASLDAVDMKVVTHTSARRPGAFQVAARVAARGREGVVVEHPCGVRLADAVAKVLLEPVAEMVITFAEGCPLELWPEFYQ